MADEEARTDETHSEETDAASTGSDNEGAEDKRPDDTLAENKTCPECGAPVDDVRATCINCGYEYGEEDHEDPGAGNEFMSGSQVDDQGNEQTDEQTNEQTNEQTDEETDADESE